MRIAGPGADANAVIDEFSVVDVWIGRFPNRERLDRYLEEHYDDMDDEAPISEFARDQGQWFYDHDFVASEFFDTPADLCRIVDAMSLETETQGEILRAAEAWPEANVLLLVHGRKIESPRPVSGTDVRLDHLGRWGENGID